MQRPPQTGVDPQSQRGQKEGTTAVGLLCAGQRFGKKNENGLSNSQKRVGIDRQLCCNGLIIRYDYQLQQNMRVVFMIALKPTTTNGIPQLINAFVTLKTHYTSHLDNTQKEVRK